MKMTLQDTHSLPGPDDIHYLKTPNGITFLGRENKNSPSVVVSGYLPAGSLFDPDPQLGLADFTALMLSRGTISRDFHSLHDSLESAGANIGFSASVHTTSFNGRCLSEDLPMLLDILADCLRNPTFPSDQVEKLRAQLLTSLSIRAQDTASMASLTFDQLLFSGHPYSRPEDGFIETVQTITQEHLVDFHQRLYGPIGMVISVVGEVDPARAADLVAEKLGDWQNLHPAETLVLPPFHPLARNKSRHVTIRDKSQSDLVIGSAGPRRLDAEFMPASLGNSILGQFGMMGRIGEAVRERSGLAYYAYSTLNVGIGPGSWEVSAGVNPVNVRKAVNLIKKELAEFHEKGVTRAELDDSQANFIGRLPLSLESNAGVASALLNIERYDLGLDYYQLYPELVRSVTQEQVLAAFRKFIDPQKLVVAVAGE